MNFDCGIYAITSPSGKQYIGQAVSFKRRWYGHLLVLRKGTHACRGLQNAYRKYGESALVFSKIAFVPVDQLDMREQEQIDARPRGMLYNVALSVTSPMRGRKLSAEARAKVSAHLQTRIASPETRAKLSAASAKNMTAELRAKLVASKLGKPRSAETKAKLSALLKGRIVLPETRAKIASTLAGIERTADHRAKISATLLGTRVGADHCLSKVVLCIETGQRFESGRLAAKWLRENGKPNATHAHISATCSGRRGSAYGYRWAYADAPLFDARGLIKHEMVAA